MDTLIGLLLVAFNVFFWTWLYRRGWYRPFVFVLIGIYWDKLVFGLKFWLFSRRRDKIDAFLDEAERRKRHPIAGVIEKPDQ